MGQNDGDASIGTSSGTTIKERTSEKVKVPSMFKVLLLNDDFTPMDFVVHILKKFFKKTDPEANQIMLRVHQEGKGLAGTYPFEIAEMKVEQVNAYSKRHRHPLKSVMEEE